MTPTPPVTACLPTVRLGALPRILDELPQRPIDETFGPDIDTAHAVLLDPQSSASAKEAALRRWIQTDRAVAKGLAIDIAIVDEADLARGDLHVGSVIRRARLRWKARASRGESSAFLILFNSVRLARAVPGDALASVCQHLASLYLQEVGVVERDVVYTEAVPLLDRDGGWALFKASTQLFYSGAHLMRNHDRRLPGGVAIIANAPGHFARSLVHRSIECEYAKAVGFVAKTAVRSVGNGGIFHPDGLGSSWHHADDAEGSHQAEDERGAQPRTTPADGPEGLAMYAAAYQADVLVQSDVVTDAEPRLREHRPEDVWAAMHLAYISTRATPPDDPDFGWFNGLPIEGSARFLNPWLPRRAQNSVEFNY
jgi:hypothetical protein